MAQPATGRTVRTLADLHAHTEAVIADANATGPVLITGSGRFLARIDGIEGLSLEAINSLAQVLNGSAEVPATDDH